MEPKDPKNKAGGILEAFASGSTCEQILAADKSLTYHDIFHAVSETPTTHWKRFGGRSWFKKRLRAESPLRRAIQHRVD